MARTVKDPEERRSELIACARQFFYTKGYESTSVSDIVGEVGVAQGTFYYYFDSKQAILEAMVDEISQQGFALMRGIVADHTLNALEKWNRAMKVVGDWKLERKAEMMTILRVMARDENALLRYKLQEQTIRRLTPEFAKIIAQGVKEGFFETPYVQESAEIVLAIIYSVQDHLSEILLNPPDYDNPVMLVERKFSAVVAAIERVLDAPPGSISLTDTAALNAWFDDTV